MTMERVDWTPRRNTEREARRKHWVWWVHRDCEGAVLIGTDPDPLKGDLRWIQRDQITHWTCMTAPACWPALNHRGEP